MASFETPRLLSEKESYTKVLGYCSVPDSDEILMTHDSKVVLLQPYNGKFIQSWTCPSSRGHRFTGSAIFSEEEQEFVMIQNRKTLRTIKLQDFNETETFTVQYPIHCVASPVGTSPIVIFGDGSIFHLEDVLEDPKKIQPRESIPLKIKRIYCVDTATLDDGSLLVLIICSDTTENYHVLAGIMKANNPKVLYMHASIMKKDQRIVSICSLRNHDIPMFAVLWSDQSLTKLSSFVSFQSINVELDNVTTVEEGANNLKIAAISQDQLIVLTPGRYIECYDMTFGSTLQKIEVDADVNQIFVLNDLILLDSPNRIQKIQFTAQPITLAQAIMKTNRSGVLALPNHVKWNVQQSKKTTLFTEEDIRLIRKLIDTTDSDTFVNIWNDILTKDRSEDFTKELCQSDAMKKILSKFGLEDDKKKFWPRAALEKMLGSGFILGRWCNGLISQLVDKSDWAMLHYFMSNVDDIPEGLVVQCLTGIFTGETISSDSCQPNENTGELEKFTQLDYRVPESAWALAKRILGLKYNEVELRDELAAMPFQAAQLLAININRDIRAIVHKILVLYAGLDNANFILVLARLLGRRNLLSKWPTLEQVVNWVNLLLDSHISEIIMLENCWPMVQQLQDNVDVLSDYFEDLGVVGNLLTRITCRLPKPRKGRYLYSVEIMHLGY